MKNAIERIKKLLSWYKILKKYPDARIQYDDNIPQFVDEVRAAAFMPDYSSYGTYDDRLLELTMKDVERKLFEAIRGEIKYKVKNETHGKMVYGSIWIRRDSAEGREGEE